MRSPRMERRWDGIKRPYSREDVKRLSGRMIYFNGGNELAKNAAIKLWRLLCEEFHVKALGAQTGMQAVQMAKAGLKAIYCSGWQTAADANLAGETYPDQSLYPADSVPALVRRINNALERQDQIQWSEGKEILTDFGLPIVADAEAGFGGIGNVFVLMKQMIEAGAAGVHFEDQLGSEKKCGHLGGKVLIPTRQFINALVAGRLASDVLDVPTVIVARTDAEAATLLTSEIDDRDKLFILGKTSQGIELDYKNAVDMDFCGEWLPGGVRGTEKDRNPDWEPYRTVEGYYRIRPGVESAIARAIAYASYADMLWMETKTPSLEEAKKFSEGVHAVHPGKFLMYNCSPSFNWLKHFMKECDGDQERAMQVITDFQDNLSALGYKFNFITLAGFHSLNEGMFKLALAYKKLGMTAYVHLQESEFELEKDGFEAVRHQREVGTGYFDEIAKIITGGTSSTTAMDGSTEKEQFKK